MSPWNLIYDDEKYYLVGYDHLHKEIRHFRVDKMLDVEEVDLKRKGITKFRQINKAKYTRQHFRMYGGEIQTVTLLCENEMSNVIVDQFGHALEMIQPDENHFKVNVDVAVSEIPGLGDCSGRRGEDHRTGGSVWENEGVCDEDGKTIQVIILQGRAFFSESVTWK